MNKHEEQEKRNDRIAFITSLAIHVIIALIALFFVTCWKAPGPPWPDSEIGVIVDFGTDAEGSGEIKENTEASDQESEQPDEATPQPSESSPVEPTPSTVQTYDTDSDVHEDPVVKPTPVTKPVVTKVESKTPVETKKEPTTNASSSAPKNNNGDDANKTGDKGNPNSKAASHVYSGKSGGGEDGLDFKINGWKPDKKPSGRDVIKERGEIQFEFTVDEYGDVQNLIVLRTTFTPDQTKVLKDRFLKIAFIQTSNGKPPVTTKGTLTWKFDY